MEDFTMGCGLPGYHGQKWLLFSPFGKAGVPMCLACGVLTLEDRNQLSVRKHFILGVMLDALHSAPGAIVKIIAEDDQVPSNIIGIILDLISQNDESLASSAAESVLLLLCQLKSEKLALAVVGRLTTQIQKECNYQQSILEFEMLGRVILTFPELHRALLSDKGEFLHYMATGMTYPCEKVKLVITDTLVKIYQSTPIAKNEMFMTVHSQVIRGLLVALRNSQEKEVLKNALGLLKILLMQKETKLLNVLMQIQHENACFASSIKKILCSNDSVLQNMAVQCISHVLKAHSNSGSYISLLLDANIPEFLFEILSTTNELLIESTLCCICLFTENSLFFAKHHGIYGVETLIRVAYQLLDMKNWRLSVCALQLISMMFARNKPSVSGVPYVMVFRQAVQLLEKTLQPGNQMLLIASSNFLSIFLRKENLPNPIPCPVIMNLLEKCMQASCKFLLINDCKIDEGFLKQLQRNCSLAPNAHGNVDLPVEFKLLESGLQVAYACARLAVNYSLDPCARESTFLGPSQQSSEVMEGNAESETQLAVNDLTNFVLAALDAVFLPYSLALDTSNELSKRIWAHILSILSEIYESFGWKSCDKLLGLTTKLMEAGFIKIFWNNEMLTYSTSLYGTKDTMKKICCNTLKWLLWSLLKQEKVNEQYLNAIKDGVEQFDDSFENCAAVLLQKCDFSFTSQRDFKTPAAQMTFIFICYASFFHRNETVSIDILQPNLAYFITLNAEQRAFPTVVLKQLVFLLACCTLEAIKRNLIPDMASTITEADSIIKGIVRKLPCPDCVYTHHKTFLWWCFFACEHKALINYTLCEWMKCCIPSPETHLAEPTVLLILIKFMSVSKLAQASFLTCLESTRDDFAKRAFSFLQLVWNYETRDNQEMSNKKGLIRFFSRIIQHLPARLINILMESSGNDNSKLHDVLPILLDILSWSQKQLPNCVIQPDVDAKLAFHVATLCTSKSISDQLLISCLQYLWVILKYKRSSENHRVWCLLVENKNFTVMIQNCLKLNGSSIHLEALRLVVVMMRFQVECGIKTEARVKAPAAKLFQWLSSTCHELQLLTLEALRYLIKMRFQKAFLKILVREMITFHDNEESLPELSTNDFRILFISLLNFVAKHKPIVDEFAVPCLTGLLEFLHDKHPDIEKHLLLQPWVRIALENRLGHTKDIDEHTWNLFDKWLTYPQVNCAITGAVQHLASKISVGNTLSGAQYNTAVLKICHSPYGERLYLSTKITLPSNLQGINDTQQDDNEYRSSTQAHCIADDVQSRQVALSIEPQEIDNTSDILKQGRNKILNKEQNVSHESNELHNEKCQAKKKPLRRCDEYNEMCGDDKKYPRKVKNARRNKAKEKSNDPSCKETKSLIPKRKVCVRKK